MKTKISFKPTLRDRIKLNGFDATANLNFLNGLENKGHFAGDGLVGSIRQMNDLQRDKIFGGFGAACLKKPLKQGLRSLG